MGGCAGGGVYFELTAEERALDVLVHFDRWISVVEGTLEHEPQHLVEDYSELQKTCKDLGMKLTQIGRGLADRVRLKTG